METNFTVCFTTAMIYLADNAYKGTAFHEAFHAVFRLALSEKQQKALYLEAVTKTS